MHGRTRRFALAVLVAATLPMSSPAAAAVAPAEPTAVAFSVGTFGTGGDGATEVGVELRWANRLPWGLGAAVGVSANEDEAFWGYLGLRRPFALGGTRWRLLPHFAVVAYEKGDSRDLGQTLEFRSGLELHYAFRNRNSLGLSFYHMSNASLSEVNPGVNSLLLVWALPIGP